MELKSGVHGQCLDPVWSDSSRENFEILVLVSEKFLKEKDVCSLSIRARG